MDTYLDKVIQLANVSHPIGCPASQDWNKIEYDLGVKLPEDLKIIISKLGIGVFGEFWLLVPGGACQAGCFSIENALKFSEDMDWLADKSGIKLYPDHNGFLRIGGSSNGIELLLRADATSRLTYVLLLWEIDYRRTRRIDMSLSQFLHNLYHGLIPGKWARETRELIWEEGESFFTPGA